VHVLRAITAILTVLVAAGCGAGEAEREVPAPQGVAACAPEDVAEGAALFAEVGCLGCHTYAGEGSQNLDAPDLTDIGMTERDPEWYVDHLTEGPDDHPTFATLDDGQLLAIGEFLHASRGC
jgi:mono/diheme cytochrome c family protein